MQDLQSWIVLQEGQQTSEKLFALRDTQERKKLVSWISKTQIYKFNQQKNTFFWCCIVKRLTERCVAAAESRCAPLSSEFFPLILFLLLQTNLRSSSSQFPPHPAKLLTTAFKKNFLNEEYKNYQKTPRNFAIILKFSTKNYNLEISKFQKLVFFPSTLETQEIFPISSAVIYSPSTMALIRSSANIQPANVSLLL